MASLYENEEAFIRQQEASQRELNYSPDKQSGLDSESLTKKYKGVLWIKDPDTGEEEPVYVVERVADKSGDYVYVYETEMNDEGFKIAEKAVDRLPVEGEFSAKTRLGELAKRFFSTPKYKKVPRPYIFMAPIIPEQINTFTQKRENGFFEREPDRVEMVEGKRAIVRGKNTGIFIGLSSIEWEKNEYYPVEDIVQAVQEEKQSAMNPTNSAFYDIDGVTGSNNNNTNKF